MPAVSTSGEHARLFSARGAAPKKMQLSCGAAARLSACWHRRSTSRVTGRRPHRPLDRFEVHLLDVGIIPRIREMPEVRPEGATLAVRARERNRQIRILTMVIRVFEIEVRRIEMRKNTYLLAGIRFLPEHIELFAPCE